MKFNRNSIVLKLAVYMLTILGATAAMLYFNGSITGLMVSIGVLIAGFFFYAFGFNGKNKR